MIKLCNLVLFVGNIDCKIVVLRNIIGFFFCWFGYVREECFLVVGLLVSIGVSVGVGEVWERFGKGIGSLGDVLGCEEIYLLGCIV